MIVSKPRMTAYKLKITFILCCVMGISFGFSAPAFAQMSESRAHILFAEAAEDYKQGHYKEAIDSYEEVLQSGWESGALYFNLGNGYFKNGQLGKAILNYERAQMLTPRDSDLRFNYHYAFLQVKPSFAAPEKNIFEVLIDKHMAFYTSGEMIVFTCAGVFAFGVVFMLLLYFPKIMVFARWMMGIAGFIFIVFLGGFILKEQITQSQAIVIENAQARFEPRLEATVYFELSEGSQVGLVEDGNAWVKIKRGDGKLGWVEKAKIEKVRL